MSRVSKVVFALAILVLACAPAQAFWLQGTNVGTGGGAAADFATTFPADSTTGLHVMLLIAAVIYPSAPVVLTLGTTSACSASPSGWNVIAQTNDDGQSDHNVSWDSGVAYTVAFWHPYSSGDSAPFICGASNATRYSYMYLDVDFASISSFIDQASANVQNTASATASFNSLTPTNPGEEMVMVGVGVWGNSSTLGAAGSQGVANTCGQATYWGITGQPTATAYGAFSTVSAHSNSPDIYAAQFNTSPCTPAAITGETFVISTTGKNVGMAFLLNPAPSAKQKHPLNGRIAQGNGLYTIEPGATGGSWDDVASRRWYVDGGIADAQWANLQPFASATYYWDYTDNQLENLKILGQNATLTLQSGNETVCGLAQSGSLPGTVSCASANWPGSQYGVTPNKGTGASVLSRTPDWIQASNSSDNNVATTPILSVAQDSALVVPTASAVLLFPTDSVGLLYGLNNLISAAGTRWCNASAGKCTNTTNIAAINIPGLNGKDDETSYTDGGSTVTCTGGTAADCQAITGDADWTATHSYALNTTIIPSVNNATVTSFKVTSCTGGCPQNSGGSEPNWATSCTSTCTDGSVVWTNEGAPIFNTSDGTQWGALSVASACTGSGTPYTNCSGKGTVSSAQTYKINQTTCGAQDGTICGALFYGETTIGGYVHTAFPNALLNLRGFSAATIGGDSYSGGGSTTPCGLTGFDPLTVALEKYYSNGYAVGSGYSNPFRWQENDLGIKGNQTGPINGYVHMPRCMEPFVLVGYQDKKGISNITWTSGQNCQTGAQGLFSYSASDCVPPMVYALLENTMGRYLEVHTAELDNAGSQPWLIWMHQSAWGY